MSDPNMSPATRPGDGWLDPGPSNIQLIYICYLVGFVVGITTLIGVVVAYLNRGKAGGWVETHYTWAIRTFWIGLLYGFVSFLLMFLVIGFLTALATVIWVIVRVVIGLQAVSKREPIRNPESWII
ncbi:hypothetical protein FY036_13055 [Mesorhizobium microcysteis]|jgi:uncharacterized membrane protein|uniref:DUF4870 domain-containing protein n=1 Tax=Neoaquamicrobium microcysteis TaxID=2682781 RepID=A0A5D4GZN0_9HYPH|nr:DUF4870 domain-containing protein [Mesorhizobium microcysteis]TYR32010.1 hypothetical protein FY036_13055 [Mesorhizobium microcysteis]